MRVIIVDDESLIRMDLRDLIERAGHEVVGEGKHGGEAIALVKLHNPDVVLMDVKMPELDGIEAARQIHRLGVAPVVLLTAYSQEDLLLKAMDSGVYGYLVKPVREDQVVPALLMAIGRFQAEQKINADRESLAQSLEDRKYVSRAIGILMMQHSLTEEEAYRRLRKFCMDKKRKIADVARVIVEKSDTKS